MLGDCAILDIEVWVKVALVLKKWVVLWTTAVHINNRNIAQLVWLRV